MKSALHFRPLTASEAAILARLLQVDEPLYVMLRKQLPELQWAAALDSWGSFMVAASNVEGATVAMGCRSLPYLGVTKDVDGIPVQFAVFVDRSDRLIEVEITRLDGQPLRGPLVPESIALQLDQPGAVI